jgi:fucose permease
VAAVFAAVALASLLLLSYLHPPAPANLRIAALAALGGASGGLLASLLYALAPEFSANPATVTNRAGFLFGSGCLLSTLVVGLTYFSRWLPLPTLILSAVSLFVLALLVFGRNTKSRSVVPLEEDGLRDSTKDLRSIAAVLFTLLLFFQFANEFAIAGWLPLFLIHRIGSNPVWAIYALAGYFFALMIGRLIAQRLLPRVNHRNLLLAGMSTAILGCVLLSVTDSLDGACIAVIVIGGAFAPIFPLVAEKLDDRFSYQPRFYNNTFSIAIGGAMCVPWLLGYVAALNMRYVMLLPAIGSVAVLILGLLIMLEAHLMSGNSTETTEVSRAVR